MFTWKPSNGKTDLVQDLPSDDDSLNLIGSFENLGQFRIPEHSFYWKVLCVSVSSQDLNGIRSDLHRSIAGKALGH